MMVIFYALLAYLLYRLVFGFIIPVYRTTRRVRKGFREMQEQMRQAREAQNPYGNQPGGPSSNGNGTGNGKPSVGEYIDFEEIK